MQAIDHLGKRQLGSLKELSYFFEELESWSQERVESQKQLDNLLRSYSGSIKKGIMSFIQEIHELQLKNTAITQERDNLIAIAKNRNGVMEAQKVQIPIGKLEPKTEQNLHKEEDCQEPGIWKVEHPTSEEDAEESGDEEEDAVESEDEKEDVEGEEEGGDAEEGIDAEECEVEEADGECEEEEDGGEGDDKNVKEKKEEEEEEEEEGKEIDEENESSKVNIEKCFNDKADHKVPQERTDHLDTDCNQVANEQIDNTTVGPEVVNDNERSDEETKSKHNCELSKHMQSKPDKKMKGRSGKKLKCEQCPYATSVKSCFIAHSLVHMKRVERKKFKCDKCPYVTPVRSRLKTHSIVHNDLRNHLCTKCPYKAKSKDTLQGHIKSVHENLRDKVCDRCGYATSNPSTLSEHKQTVHNTGEKTFACDQCPYRAYMRKILMKHIKSVHVGREYKFNCEQCSFKSNSRGNLTTHTLKVHK